MEFDLFTPRDLSEALSILASEKIKTHPMGGGTDLIPLFKNRQINGPVMSMVNLSGLNQIEESSNQLQLGAGVKLASLVRYKFTHPALEIISKGARYVASPQLREMGTLGGNLSLDTRCIYYNKEAEWRKCLPACAKVGGEICHAIGRGTDCFAVFSSDLAPVFLSLSAQITLSSKKGDRTIKLVDYYSSDGANPIKKRSDELLTRILVPLDFAPDQAKIFTDYKKFSLRKAIDFPLASVAGRVCVDNNHKVTQLSFALGGVERKPVLVDDLEDLATSSSPFSESLAKEIAHRCFKAAKPVKNLASSPLQRKRMVRSMTLDMLADFAARIKEV